MGRKNFNTLYSRLPTDIQKYILSYIPINNVSINPLHNDLKNTGDNIRYREKELSRAGTHYINRNTERKRLNKRIERLVIKSNELKRVMDIHYKTYFNRKNLIKQLKLRYDKKNERFIKWKMLGKNIEKYNKFRHS